MEKISIKEAIVVEGRDDTAALSRAVNCVTIETHGFGMAEEMWALLEKADKEQGLIVFTDPDRAGETIRRKIMERFPHAKQAFLPKSKALKKNNVGVENAKAEDIIEALLKAHPTKGVCEAIFDEEDLIAWNLIGTADARKRRETLGDQLGIGYGNSKAFLKKLNQFSIDREAFISKAKELE